MAGIERDQSLANGEPRPVALERLFGLALRGERVADLVVRHRDVALQGVDCRDRSRAKFSRNEETGAIGGERIGDCAAPHQNVADALVRNRQVPFPSRIAGIVDGETFADGEARAIGGERVIPRVLRPEHVADALVGHREIAPRRIVPIGGGELKRQSRAVIVERLVERTARDQHIPDLVVGDRELTLPVARSLGSTAAKRRARLVR